MNRSDLVNAVADSTDIAKSEAGRIVDSILTGITEALRNGAEVRLSGFGRFTTTERASRQGRNPRTGEAVPIAAGRSVKFKPAKPLKDALNG